MARPGNSNLHDSSRNKQDEFYTNLQLIEDELDWYRPHFMGKRVLCNCDDPYESNFFKYFAMNFNALGLKSLTATCYATSPVVYTQLDLFGDDGVRGAPALPLARQVKARSPATASGQHGKARSPALPADCGVRGGGRASARPPPTYLSSSQSLLPFTACQILQYQFCTDCHFLQTPFCTDCHFLLLDSTSKPNSSFLLLSNSRDLSLASRIQFQAVGFEVDVFDAAFFTDVPDADPFQRHVLDGQSRIAK